MRMANRIHARCASIWCPRYGRTGMPAPIVRRVHPNAQAPYWMVHYPLIWIAHSICYALLNYNVFEFVFCHIGGIQFYAREVNVLFRESS